MSFSLAYCPSDALREILSFVDGLKILKLRLCGDSRLNQKLSGAVERFSCQLGFDLSKTSSPPLDLSHFRQITALSVELLERRYEATAPLVLRVAQGRILRYLRLKYRESLLIQFDDLPSPVPDEEVNHPPKEQTPPRNPFLDLFEALPNLHTLDLDQQNQLDPSHLPRGLVSCVLRMYKGFVHRSDLLYGGLPPNLESLTIIGSVFSSPLPPTLAEYNIPTGVLTTGMLNSSVPRSLKSLQGYLVEQNASEILALLPPSITSLFLDGHNQLSLEEALLLPGSLEKTNLELKSRALVDAEIIQKLPVGLFYRQCQQHPIPGHLVKFAHVDTTTISLLGPLDGCKLPSRLFSLTADVDASYGHAFPDTLNSLIITNLLCLEPLLDLPSSLRSLKIDKVSARLQPEISVFMVSWFARLPRKMISLVVREGIYLPSLSDSHLSGLPQSLATLHLPLAEVQDLSIFSALPPKIQNLDLVLTPPPDGAWKPVCSFEHLHQLTSLRLTAMQQCVGFGDYLLAHLPRKLESISWKSHVTSEEDVISANALMHLPPSLIFLSMPFVQVTPIEARKFDHIPKDVYLGGEQTKWLEMRKS